MPYHFKVDNPNLSNEVVQMKSEHLQPPIYYRNSPNAFKQKLNQNENVNKSSKIKIANLRK